jgi:hypothetical protein
MHMKNWLFLFSSLVFFQACNKATVQSQHDAVIVGGWVWAYSGVGALVEVGPSSGAMETLTFTANGSLYVSHNDSTGPSVYLGIGVPMTFLPKTIMDTLTYQLGSQPAICDTKVTYPALKTFGLVNDVYKYSISGDTLFLSGDPCLGPGASVYLRN